MIKKNEIERLSLTTSKRFDEVIAVVNAAIGHPDMAEFGRSTHEARSFAELKSAIEKGFRLGPRNRHQLSAASVGQEKAESDICKEFLKNSVAGVVILQPFIVREVKGVVLVPYCDDPLPNVLIELRDGAGKFTATKTDSRGQFKFGKINEGTYTFKITLDGFPSLVGTVVLQKHANNSAAIRIELPLGPLG